jgi:ABC-type sugar transport system permease subunit
VVPVVLSSPHSPPSLSVVSLSLFLVTPFILSAFYSSTDYDVAPQRQLSAHAVLCPGCANIDPSDRDLLMQKSLFLSQFLRLFMIIDGIFLVLWAVMAWPFFFGLLLIIAGFYGAKYYNTGLASMVSVTRHSSYLFPTHHATPPSHAVPAFLDCSSSTVCTCWPTWRCASGG